MEKENREKGERKREKVIALAKNTRRYCNLLITQCDGYMMPERTELLKPNNNYLKLQATG